MSSPPGIRHADLASHPPAVVAQATGRSTPLVTRELVERLASAYSAGWTLLLAGACACVLMPAARWLAQHELGIDLHMRIRPAPAPHVRTLLWLIANNLRATAWPLAPALLGAERSPMLRRVVHAAVLVSLAADLLPVAAALGVYRRKLVPYLPHLPLELYAITTGPTSWLLAARGRCSRRQLLEIAVSVLVALSGAAFLETWVVPHR